MSKIFFSSFWEKLSPEEKKNYLVKELDGLIPVVVYVDDDSDALDIFSFCASQLGLETFVSNDTSVALEFITKNKSRILMIISDYKMPGMDGLKFREKSLSVALDIPFAVLSGYVDRDLALKGMELKISAFLEKPFRANEFLNLLQKEGEPRLHVLKDEYEMLKGFTDDASNLLDNIEELCLELERDQHNQDAINRIFGMVHTIKGSSGFFDPKDLHTFAHAFEDLIKDAQNGTCAVTPQLVSIFLKGNDVLKVFVDEFRTGIHTNHDVPELIKMLKATTPQAVAIQEVTVETNGVTKEIKASELRVSMTLLNEFMQTSGEMTVIRNMINKAVKGLEKQYQGNKDIALLGELLEEMHKINSDVQNKITDIRRVSVSSLTKPLIRIVRDTARALNKEVEFMIEGDDLRLDNSIAEVLTNSLVHMMRNSIDHGIEDTVTREKLGKFSKGKLLLSFRYQGENVIVEIKDDGAGINVERIREKVIEKGLRSAAVAEKMSQEELHHMIFDSGLSTAQQVTDFSGRGVGMSMVKDSVESMHGKIHIKSKQGQGSEFKLEIPVPKSVTIMNCLFVNIDGLSYGIPQDRILKVMERNQLASSDYALLQGAEVIRYNNKLVSLSSVSKLMGKEKDSSEENLIVIVKSEESIFALKVESVLDIEDAVIKPLGLSILKTIGIYLGGTFLSDGSVGMIFDIDGMAKKIGINKQRVTDHSPDSTTNLDREAIVNRNVIMFELQKPGYFCIEEKDILRIEMIDRGAIQFSSGTCVIPYRENVMTLIELDKMIDAKDTISNFKAEGLESLAVVILEYHSQYVGLIVKSIVDLKAANGQVEKSMSKQKGIQGCFVIDNDVVSLIDLDDILNNSDKPILDVIKQSVSFSAA